MGRLEFRELLKRGKFLRYKAGDAALDVASTKSEAESCMFVVIEGAVVPQQKLSQVTLYFKLREPCL